MRGFSFPSLPVLTVLLTVSPEDGAFLSDSLPTRIDDLLMTLHYVRVHLYLCKGAHID